MSKRKKNNEVSEPVSEFTFELLVELCQKTDDEMRGQAARAVNTGLVVRNWLFGYYIVEYEQAGADRATYGTGVIKKLAASLKERSFRGGSLSSLKQMKAFYLAHQEKSQTASGLFISQDAKSQTVSGLLAQIESKDRKHRIWDGIERRLPLSWSHYVTLLTVSSADARRFYEIESVANNWSVRELARQLSSSLYERLAVSRDPDEIRRLAAEGQIVAKAADLIRNPFVLEFLDLKEDASYSEKQLETAIIDKLQAFLLELGKGFLFESRQRRFTFDAKHYYVDLVLYNRLLRCYVLLDLKLDELTHSDLGQMQMYVNYFDRHVKLDDELPTIGIVLCARKNDAMVELTLPIGANIFASKYQLYLPSKEELKAELEKIEAELDADHWKEQS